MGEGKKPSAWFAMVFMLTLAAIVLGVYVTFSSYQRAMAMQRKEASKSNLGGIGRALNAYAAKHNGRFPDRVGLLTREVLPDDSILVHAAWPDRPGYMYIPGVRPDDDADRTLLVFENVPERKRKLGTQVLFVSGRIEALTSDEFVERLKVQEAAWKRTGRVWLPEALGAKMGSE